MGFDTERILLGHRATDERGVHKSDAGDEKWGVRCPNEKFPVGHLCTQLTSYRLAQGLRDGHNLRSVCDDFRVEFIDLSMSDEGLHKRSCVDLGASQEAHDSVAVRTCALALQSRDCVREGVEAAQG